MHSNHEKAHAAPRCQYIRLNDQPCTQPALRNHIFCRFHDLVDHPLPDSRLIPFVEDAASLQLALMQVISSLQLGKMDRRTAGTILYALQIAASNLKYLAAETGRAYDLKSTNASKKNKDKDEVPGPSLADVILERFGEFLERPADDEDDEYCEADLGPAVSPATQDLQSAVRGTGVPPVTENSDSHATPQPSRPARERHTPAAETATPKLPLVVDKLHACAAACVPLNRYTRSQADETRDPDSPWRGTSIQSHRVLRPVSTT